ncbi:MAG: hypothetical protein ACOYNN_16710 [Terrimicrobiaceae bacterium]
MFIPFFPAIDLEPGDYTGQIRPPRAKEAVGIIGAQGLFRRDAYVRRFRLIVRGGVHLTEIEGRE